MIKGDAEGRIEISGAALPGSDWKSRGGGGGASRVTARRRYSHPETLQLAVKLRLKVNAAKSAVDRPW
jgi:hypothetical protein